MSHNDKNSSLSIEDAILLVEDSRVVQSSLKKTLMSLTQSQVMQAKNGAEALEIVKKSPFLFKVIFLDLTMPVMGGVECIQQIRSLEGPASKTTIVAATGNQNNLSSAELQEIGLNGAIIKPINFQNIFHVLGKLPLPSYDAWLGVIN